MEKETVNEKAKRLNDQQFIVTVFANLALLAGVFCF